MKTHFLIGFFILTSGLLHAEESLHIHCEGKDYGVLSPFILKADLETKAPLLESTTFKKLDTGELEEVKKETFVSQKTACGVNINFEKECTSRIRKFGGDYSFEFSCGPQVSGEVYTTFISPTEGILTLACHKPLQNSSFENCQLLKN